MASDWSALAVPGKTGLMLSAGVRDSASGGRIDLLTVGHGRRERIDEQIGNRRPCGPPDGV